MSYLFLKKPYGIVNDGHQVHIYNYKTQKIEKTYKFEDIVPPDFGERLSVEQIISFEQLLNESSLLEKRIIKKLVEQGEYVQLLDEVSEEHMQTEAMMYDAKKIGINYANSNEQNAKYKVYKNLRNNIENTNIVVVGYGLVGMKMVNELIGYPWKNIYLIQTQENQRENIYEKMHNSSNHTSSLFDEGKVKIVSDINKVIDDNDGNIHVIYASEDGEVDNLFVFNKLMVQKNISWSLLASNSEELIIGPTFFPDQMGCIQCGFEKSLFVNKNNIMSYEASIMAGILASDLPKIIGQMPEAIVEDISITLGRAFCVNRKTLDGESKDVKADIMCDVCGNK